jgi:hypothetical protein
MKLFLAGIALASLIGCNQTETKRDVFLLCEGNILNSKPSPHVVKVSSTFYIGADFVEQDGKRYSICEDRKTQIIFSDNCKMTELTAGSIDLVAKTIRVDETLKKIFPNTQDYDCKLAKSLR